MTDLDRGVFRGTKGHDGNANFAFPRKDVVHTSVGSIQKSLPDFFVAEGEFHLKLAIADDELASGRELHGEWIVGQESDDLIALCEMQ